MVKKLIPQVKKAWKRLMVSVRDCSITIHELKRTFSQLNSDEEYMVELRTLAVTGDGTPMHSLADAAKLQWMTDAASKLRDYGLLVRMQSWLPGTNSEVPCMTVDASYDEAYM